MTEQTRAYIEALAVIVGCDTEEVIDHLACQSMNQDELIEEHLQAFALRTLVLSVATPE